MVKIQRNNMEGEFKTLALVMDMNITFVKRNNKWVEYETK